MGIYTEEFTLSKGYRYDEKGLIKFGPNTRISFFLESDTACIREIATVHVYFPRKKKTYSFGLDASSCKNNFFFFHWKIFREFIKEEMQLTDTNIFRAGIMIMLRQTGMEIQCLLT